MKKPGNKKLLKSNRISGFQKADHQKLPIDKTRRIISQKFHFFKIFKVGLIGALIFGILFELALELHFTELSGRHSVLERPLSEVNGRLFFS